MFGFDSVEVYYFDFILVINYKRESDSHKRRVNPSCILTEKVNNVEGRIRNRFMT
jgi:hypothetical protein